MKRYEDYKPTGAEWIPSIPASWDIQKIGTLFAQRKEKVSDKDFAPISVTKNGILPQLAKAAKTDDGDNRKKVCVGDFVINSRSDRKGSCGVSDLEGSVSLINIILQPRDQLSEGYAHYLLRNHLFSEEYYRNGRGIVADLWTTRYSEMKTILLPVPPRAEQDQIVRYLDWQVSIINRLIAAKRKQIALLREQIQQTITDVVYHGVDQTVNYQPVKMLYVDTIPEHWECKRGKFLFAEHDIRSTDGKEELLSVSHITGVTPRSQKNITMFKAESLVNYKICRKNDIAANTMWMWQGAIAVSSYHGVISPSYNTYHQIDNAYDSAYLDYMLRSKPLVDEYYVRSTGIRKSRLRLYPEQLLDMFFPVPPVEEQKRIAAVIAEKTQAANDFIAAIEKQIEKINEFRVRMISDVVTGQIDVRGIEVPEFEMVQDTVEEQEAEEIMQET